MRQTQIYTFVLNDLCVMPQRLISINYSNMTCNQNKTSESNCGDLSPFVWFMFSSRWIFHHSCGWHGIWNLFQRILKTLKQSLNMTRYRDKTYKGRQQVRGQHSIFSVLSLTIVMLEQTVYVRSSTSSLHWPCFTAVNKSVQSHGSQPVTDKFISRETYQLEPFSFPDSSLDVRMFQKCTWHFCFQRNTNNCLYHKSPSTVPPSGFGCVSKVLQPEQIVWQPSEKPKQKSTTTFLLFPPKMFLNSMTCPHDLFRTAGGYFENQLRRTPLSGQMSRWAGPGSSGSTH